jgi:hypothetical protein
MMDKPSLYGITNSNRNFFVKESWGKNQFNSSFPASLACYMNFKKIQPVYLTLNSNLKMVHSKISISDIFGSNPVFPNLYFAFESDYVPYQTMVIGNLPRIDLVTLDMSQNNNCLRGIEIKLTALPDNSTCNLSDELYGCELVVRPDTIVYLALSIANIYRENPKKLMKYFNPIFGKLGELEKTSVILTVFSKIINALDKLFKNETAKQKPLVLQPVWKTKGKSAQLHDNCLDIFVWSDFAFSRLFIDVSKNNINSEIITRHMRSVIWLAYMLYDFGKNGRIDHAHIIDKLSYNTKNDKAFSISGINTHRYMKCKELTSPRISKTEIKNIILGNGQNLLSPERRLDGIIQNSPELFV